MLFILPEKALLVLKIFKFIFFPFLSTFSRFKGPDETGIIMTLKIGLHKLANVIFGMIQKPLCIKSSKLPR